jgi:hypothetical protein
MVLATDEIDLDAVRGPQGLLIGAGPIARRSDRVAELARLQHREQRDRSRRIADFERPVDVEADQDHGVTVPRTRCP